MTVRPILFSGPMVRAITTRRDGEDGEPAEKIGTWIVLCGFIA